VTSDGIRIAPGIVRVRCVTSRDLPLLDSANGVVVVCS